MRFTRTTARVFLPILLGMICINPLAAQEMDIYIGGGAAVNDYAWAGPCGHLAMGEPGVFFGTMKKPDSEREFIYLILAKHQATKSGGSSGGGFKTGDNTVHSKGTVDIKLGDKKLAIGHELEFDTTANVVKMETLTINGKPVDFKEGRLILMDCTGSEITWKQVKVKLPGKLPDPDKREGVRETAKRVKAELSAESKEVREFLK
jgi:hypothetical protein